VTVMALRLCTNLAFTGFRRTNLAAAITTATTRSYAVDAALKSKLDSMVNESKVVVFMKGVPEAPKCGFSNAVVQILRMHNVPFSSHDVLEDEVLRQGVKEFSNWLTIPQIYIGGEVVGGCDILLQMHRSAELIDTLKAVGLDSALINEKS